MDKEYLVSILSVACFAVIMTIAFVLIMGTLFSWMIG